MNLELLLPIIITGITSALGTFLLFKVNIFKAKAEKKNTDSDNNREDFKVLIDAMKDQIKSLQEENQKIRAENKTLSETVIEHEKKITNLSIHLRVLQASYFDSPVPMWVKDEKGILEFVNESYVKEFYTPTGRVLEECLGKDDIEIWGEKTGKNFRSHDKYVRMTGLMWIGLEEHEEDGVNILNQWFFIKYPFSPDKFGIVKGYVAGMGIRLTKELIEQIKIIK